MLSQKGFTIIEVVLFLAISSSLAVVLMAGTGIAIQRQQYRDSVQSFAEFLGGQYSRAVSVDNSRADDEPCPITGINQAALGQSECVIIGRYIETEDSTVGKEGRRYLAYPVYSAVGGGSRQYAIGGSDSTYEINWGARTRLSSQTDGQSQVAILIFRDPDHGAIVTRTSRELYSPSSIGQFIEGAGDMGGSTSDDQFSSRELCVYDSGWLPSERLSVFLGARASSSDAVIVRPATEGCIDA